MTTPDRDDPQDSGPDPLLRRALDTLPLERTPPAAVWSNVARTIGASATPDHARFEFRVRRLTLRVVAVGITALVAVVALTRRTPAPNVPSREVPAMAVASAADDALDPKARAIRTQTQQWRDAVRDPVRSARWPAPTRAAIDRAIDETERALVEARADLARTPQDVIARETVHQLRDQQLTLLQHAMALLDEL